MERKRWIDLLRGFCMMAILWFHTEMYYAGHDVTPYALYVGDVLACFFFISGYLFYHPAHTVSSHITSLTSPRKKLRSIARYLLLPYFVFTTIIALTKAIASLLSESHTSHLSPLASHLTPLLDILTGHASWFIAALIVAEVIFVFQLYFTKGKTCSMLLLALLWLILSCVVGNGYNAEAGLPSPLFFQYDLWHVNEAFLALFFMTLGYLSAYHTSHLSSLTSNVGGDLQSPTITSVLLLLVLATKYLILSTHAKLVLGPIIVSNYPLFIADLLLCILLLIAITHLLSAYHTSTLHISHLSTLHSPLFTLIEWTGSHSIVYYFICGGVPFVVSRLLNSIGLPWHNYLSTLLAFIIVYIAATLLTWLIYRYTPIMKK